MNKQEFIDRLSTKDNLSNAEKIEVCQFYIDRNTVLIGDSMKKIDIQITGGSSQSINFAYHQLRQRIKEFEEWMT